MASTSLAARHTRDAHADDKITSDGAHSAQPTQRPPPPTHWAGGTRTVEENHKSGVSQTALANAVLSQTGWRPEPNATRPRGPFNVFLGGAGHRDQRGRLVRGRPAPLDRVRGPAEGCSVPCCLRLRHNGMARQQPAQPRSRALALRSQLSFSAALHALPGQP